MPVFTIDAPLGAGLPAKHKMMKDIHDALDEAYHFPDTRGWLREYRPKTCLKMAACRPNRRDRCVR
jgi:hypothetical protein